MLCGHIYISTSSLFKVVLLRLQQITKYLDCLFKKDLALYVKHHHAILSLKRQVNVDKYAQTVPFICLTKLRQQLKSHTLTRIMRHSFDVPCRHVREHRSYPHYL